MEHLTNYIKEETASESTEKIIIIGGCIILALTVAGFIGSYIGNQLKLLND